MHQDYWLSLVEPERAWTYTERYADFWLRRCKRFVRTLQEAEDLYGDAILVNVVAVSRSYDELRGSQYTTFMYTSLYNRIITELRKKQDGFEKKMVTGGHVSSGSVKDYRNKQAELENREYLNTVLGKLKAWDADAHSIYIKRKVDGMYVTEIAAIHNIDRSVVYRLLGVAERFIKKYSNTYPTPGRT